MDGEPIYEALFIITIFTEDDEITEEFTIEFAHEEDRLDMQRDAILRFTEYYPEYTDNDISAYLIHCIQTN